MGRKTTVSYVKLGSYEGTVQLPKEWLEEQLESTLDEFLDDYIWVAKALHTAYIHDLG
ncbi:hypothetical protein [Halobacillus andaensis]|uniref:hypothetical protein n=1 Tax=Halobacillus andaensis TaxID=1176239 RepID=UPI003D723009